MKHLRSLMLTAGFLGCTPRAGTDVRDSLSDVEKELDRVAADLAK